MDTILQVKGLCKKYEDFALDHVSFTLPPRLYYGLYWGERCRKIHYDESDFKPDPPR